MTARAIDITEFKDSAQIELKSGSFAAVITLKEKAKPVKSHARIAWSLLGDSTNPVVVVLGGISVDRYVAYDKLLDKNGWWEAFAGKGKAINTNNYCILSFDYLGGNGETQFLEPQGADLKITTYDQAKILLSILTQLNIQTVHAFIGSSYGGMVSLAFAELYPELIERQLVISAADKSHPRSTALRLVQRQIVELATDFGDTKRGLALARQLGMISYRSIDEFAERFSNKDDADNVSEHNSLQDYLTFHGNKFANSFNPNAFLRLSESIDSHRISPEKITTRTTLLAVDSDELVFRSQIKKLASQLKGTTRYITIKSLFGHDAFLKENTQLTPIIKTLLESDYE